MPEGFYFKSPLPPFEKGGIRTKTSLSKGGGAQHRRVFILNSPCPPLKKGVLELRPPFLREVVRSTGGFTLTRITKFTTFIK